MRIFHVPVGNYRGDYNIYESREEFKKDYPDIPIKMWYREENPHSIEVGDWVEALDGYIVQCLGTSYGASHKIKYHRFPMTTMSVTVSKNKTYWNKFYAQVARRDPYSMSNASYGERDLGNTANFPSLKAYGELVASGVNFIEAYGQVQWGYKMARYQRKTVYFASIVAALSHPIVIDIIKAKNAKFLDSLQNDNSFSNESLKKFIVDFIDNVQPGSQTHLNSIIPILTILGKWTR